jgi:hypothetical protein
MEVIAVVAGDGNVVIRFGAINSRLLCTEFPLTIEEAAPVDAENIVTLINVPAIYLDDEKSYFTKGKNIFKDNTDFYLKGKHMPQHHNKVLPTHE